MDPYSWSVLLINFDVKLLILMFKIHFICSKLFQCDYYITIFGIYIYIYEYVFAVWLLYLFSSWEKLQWDQIVLIYTMLLHTSVAFMSKIARSLFLFRSKWFLFIHMHLIALEVLVIFRFSSITQKYDITMFYLQRLLKYKMCVGSSALFVPYGYLMNFHRRWLLIWTKIL